MSTNSARGLRHELRLILRRGRQVWKLIPLRYKLALGGAARAMASPPRTRSFLRLRLGGGHVEPAGSGQVLAAEPPAEIWPRLISAL